MSSDRFDPENVAVEVVPATTYRELFAHAEAMAEAIEAWVEGKPPWTNGGNRVRSAKAAANYRAAAYRGETEG